MSARPSAAHISTEDAHKHRLRILQDTNSSVQEAASSRRNCFSMTEISFANEISVTKHDITGKVGEI